MHTYYYIFGGVIVALMVWALGSYLVVRNLEEPMYSVLEKRDGYEIREYQPYLIAETTVTGDYTDALNEGFTAIADFIFGNNTSKTSIAMTAPVLESESQSESIAMTVPVIDTVEQAKDRKISFVLPSKYTLETVPTPNNKNVVLVEVPARKVAVLRFNWYATEDRVESKTRILSDRIARDGLVPTGVVQTAQYNPPFSMPLVRRNEIIIEIQ